VTREIATRLIGLVVLVVPLVAIRWNLAGTVRRRSSLLAPDRAAKRWRLEIYSLADDVTRALADPAEVPFPVKRVRSAKAVQSTTRLDEAWTLPRVELDVEVSEPFADHSLNGLLGTGYEIRFVTGNEAVVDAGTTRLRIQAFRFQ
jgi:hypothetical protein